MKDCQFGVSPVNYSDSDSGSVAVWGERGETTKNRLGGGGGGLWLKARSGPDSAEATENTEWVRTEFTENYDLPIPGFSSVTG